MAIVEALTRVLRPQDTAYMRALRTVADGDAEADARWADGPGLAGP